MGVTDDEVMKYAISEDRIIITFDRDYGELVFKYGYKPKGVIFLRFRNFSPEYPANLLLEILHDNKLDFENKFTVIDLDQIRQRDI